MRLEDCEAKIDSAAIACNLEKNTVLDAKRSIGIRNQLKASFSDISELPTQTVLELGKKKNLQYLEKIIPDLQDKIKSGVRPTRKEIVQMFKKMQPSPSINNRVAKLQRDILDFQKKIDQRQAEIAVLLEQSKQDPNEVKVTEHKPEPKPEPEPEGKPKDDDDKIPPKPRHEGKISVVGIVNAPLHAGRRIDNPEPFTEVLDGEFTYVDDEPAPTANPPGVPS